MMNNSIPSAESVRKFLLARMVFFAATFLLVEPLYSFDATNNETDGLTRRTPHSSKGMSLLPQPKSFKKIGSSKFQIPQQAKIFIPDNASDWKAHWTAVSPAFKQCGFDLSFVQQPETSKIKVIRDTNLTGERYRIRITEQQMTLTAGSLKGFSRATATLLQLLGSAVDGQIGELEIEDQPSSSYRSIMIDMGRNPHSLGLLKETIDALWFYKLDSLHLHLTDDQRFAFPSKRFPKLWDRIITLKQFQQLDDYARVRGISIIPELEVPGHSTLLTRHYPDIFGKNSTELATHASALDGIKLLIDEMCEAFPSCKMIHVGGDEAFGVPEDAQRTLINRLQRYLKTKGKETVVWEGPSEGTAANQVNNDVIQINWRTINYPADKMLSRGHRVVNAAWDPLYIVDHYPRINFTMTSPRHIYEKLHLNIFKHVNPGIPTFSKPIEVSPSDKLIGYCMPWWEGREKNFLPMVLPRLIPMAEIAWSQPKFRDYQDFKTRAEKLEQVRALAFYPVQIIATPLAIESDNVFHNQTMIQLSAAGRTNLEIRYTTDGSEPNLESSLYKEPFPLVDSAVVRAALFSTETKTQFRHGSRKNFTRVEPQKNLALGKPVSTSATSGPPFSAERLTDGGVDNLDFYLGYPATDEDPIEVTIDLETPRSVDRIVIHAYTISNSFEKYLVQTSADGTQFETVAERTKKPEKATSSQEHSFSPRQVRLIKIISYGNRGYVFDSFSKLVEVQAFGPAD